MLQWLHDINLNINFEKHSNLPNINTSCALFTRNAATM